MPLDISAARRLVTMAQNRMADEEDLENEVFAAWEVNAIDFISCPELHDILFELIDNEIKDQANRFANHTCVFSCDHCCHALYNRTFASDYNAVMSFNDYVNIPETDTSKDIRTLAETFDFMDISSFDGRITLIQLVWLTMTDIIAPIYMESGYSYEIDEDNDLEILRISW